MKRILLLTLVFASTWTTFAQNDPKAEALLDEVYAKVKGYDNIYVDFKYVLSNAEAGINQETRGEVTMQGDKYLGDLFGAKQLYDGTKVYTIVPENEEVTIEDKTTDDNEMSPSSLLTFYRQGHTYQMDITQNVQGRKIQYVKLTPMDTDSEVKSRLLGIDAETKHIYKLIETGKNGTTTTITVNSFKTNQALSGSLFTFDAKKYEDDGYYIIRN
ncbi:outer membrane lipoprotein carrier protein LolA [Aggregatimonas sangjinii]|uniref:Outer membrane lipoprotein carrier protein LolA n=1 Tax=Aggregatimonas sangjinii TaxID=2583587 RepID=A0A5B7SN76_9FLAO|nr:outer membrane lipoprotein carrier protein LolA [Aggregatimonas sangjinii]QCX00105.1 outer membrane lipoprotein carrier protein LolA [Aggregatimonas sangjinii]